MITSASDGVVDADGPLWSLNHGATCASTVSDAATTSRSDRSLLVVPNAIFHAYRAREGGPSPQRSGGLYGQSLSERGTRGRFRTCTDARVRSPVHEHRRIACQRRRRAPYGF